MDNSLVSYDKSPLQDFRHRPERWRNRVQFVLQNIAANRDLISPVQLFHTHERLHAFRYLPSRREEAGSLVGSDMRTWDPRLLEALLMLPTRHSNRDVVQRIEDEIRKRIEDGSDKRNYVTYDDVANILNKIMPSTANEDGWKETLSKNVQKYYGNNSEEISDDALGSQIGIQGPSEQSDDNTSNYDEEGNEIEDIYDFQENTRKRPHPKDGPGKSPSSKRPSFGTSQTSRISDEATALGDEDNYGDEDDVEDFDGEQHNGRVYHSDGFDDNGYDREGYDRDGYDRDGYDDWGYNILGEKRVEEGNNDAGNDEEEIDEEEIDEEEIDEEESEEEENEEEENEEEENEEEENEEEENEEEENEEEENEEEENEEEENEEEESEEEENEEEENEEEENEEDESDEEENHEEDDDSQQDLAANQASQAQPSPIPPLAPPPPPPPPPPVQPPVLTAQPTAPVGQQRVRRRTEAEILAAKNILEVKRTRTRRNGRVSPGKYKV